ncbi:MAG: PQQ-binding-like beta-propeller repeat protein, partial [Pirellulales bacterium]|nr:PQQ-binding-like beta-propeller repeat protein [Pirellulales bacterium]
MRCLLLLMIPIFLAADWPTYQADVQRSGIAKETLSMPLYRAWTFHSPHSPRPAWPAPATGDVAHNLRDLRAVLAFDRAFQTVVAGNMVYFGSSADDKVYALDATSGKLRWTFITGGPIRLAPTIAGGKLYVGSDDGYIYCLSAADGRLLWRQPVHGPRRMLPGNGRVISAWPVRSSVVALDGMVYASAGLFPKEGVYLAAFDAETGQAKWKKRIDVSTQGYMLASQERLYIPTGRTNPALFNLADGKQVGKLPGPGGTFALVTDDCVACGPGVRDKEIHFADAKTSESIASFRGLVMIVDGPMAYMLSEKSLTALNRAEYLKLSRQRNALNKKKESLEKQLKKEKDNADVANKITAELKDIQKQNIAIFHQLAKCTLWKKPCDCPGAMILSGKTLYLGGPSKIIAVDTNKGEQLWQSKSNGNINGLAIAGERLLATTDRGAIHCFTKTPASEESVVRTTTGGSPFPKADDNKLHEEVAKKILRDLPAELGYCLVLGYGDGRLVYELARQSKLKIVCVEPDTERVAAARRAFDRAGLQGVRVAFIRAPLDSLPLPNCFANLITNGDIDAKHELPSAAEVARVLRPYGGRIVLTMGKDNPSTSQKTLELWGRNQFDDWRISKVGNTLFGQATRGALPGSGQWTHTFADASNTACSNDKLIGSDLKVQWFGRPGPNRMVDRHFRNVPPLYKDGRLFIPGNDIIYAVDAYNGTINWQAETPNSLRVGGFLDPSNMTLDEKHLYLVAENKCHRFDVRSGKRHVLTELVHKDGKTPREWGYIAAV